MNSRFKDNKWTALIITIVVIVIITMMMVYFLEKIVPVARTVKWVENTTVAYYQAVSWVEAALFEMSSSNPALQPTKAAVGWTNYWYSVKASWTKVPLAWECNSEFDADWNKIWPWEPAQLVLNNGINWANVKTKVKVPNVNWWASALNLNWTLWIINWSLSWNWKSIFADGSQIMANLVNSSIDTTLIIADLWNRLWKDTDENPMSLASFYNSTTWLSPWGANSWNSCTSYACTLKLSVVNQLMLNTSPPSPISNLEYQIDFWAGAAIPMQYAVISAEWYAYWFKRNIRKEIRQITTNEALDFTIFQ
jgi:hypothetical protein